MIRDDFGNAAHSYGCIKVFCTVDSNESEIRLSFEMCILTVLLYLFQGGIPLNGMHLP